MGIPTEARNYWANTIANNHNIINNNNNKSFVIPSPAEDQKVSDAGRSSQEAVRAGIRATVITCAGAAVPTLGAKANLNPTAQILAFSAVSIATFFVTAVAV